MSLKGFNENVLNIMTVKRLLNDQLALLLLRWKMPVMLKVIFDYWNFLFLKSIEVEFIEN